MNIGNYCNKRKIRKVKTFVIETTLLTPMYSGAVGKWMEGTHTHSLGNYRLSTEYQDFKSEIAVYCGFEFPT